MSRGLFIEPLPAEQESIGRVTEAEQLVATAFCATRRAEYLGWRSLVRRELGPVEIAYNSVGAPILPCNPEVNISVSHGAGRIAVCISNGRCAVDVESLERRYDRIASRFLSPEERALSSDSRFAAVVWSAKETLYKLSGERELDLLDDIRITSVGEDWIEGCIKNGEPIRLSIQYLDDAVVVWRL